MEHYALFIDETGLFETPGVHSGKTLGVRAVGGLLVRGEASAVLGTLDGHLSVTTTS